MSVTTNDPSSVSGLNFAYVAQAPTPVGSNITVSPSGAPVTLTYATVSGAGTTSVTTSTTPPAPLPGEYAIGSPATYYDLDTTAIYSGTITVCFSYAGVTPTPTNLLHYDTTSDTWVDVTTSVDTTDQIICRATASLSPFALVTVVMQGQTINFTSTPTSPAVVGGTYNPTATATSGLPVAITLDSTSTGCSMSGAVVSFTAVGTCVIDANQAGDGSTWAAAPQVQQSVTINPAAPTVTVSAGPFTYDGNPHAATVTVTGIGGVTVSGSSVVTYTPGGSTVPTNAGTYSVSVAFTSSNLHYKNATGSGSITINPAPTSVTYTGSLLVTISATLTLSATRTGPASCLTDYSLNASPLTGVAGTYDLGSGALPVSTSGWLQGVYLLTVTVGNNNSNCVASSDTESLTVAVAGNVALGAGTYTLASSGKVTFGFAVAAVPKTSPVQYKGVFALVNAKRWELTGMLTKYSKSGSTGIASGTGSLSWWNSTLNGGHGGWALASSSVAFTITCTAGTSKAAPTMGIQISYTPVSPQPTPLPNSAPVSLSSGAITFS
jgi:hypothetical protein